MMVVVGRTVVSISILFCLFLNEKSSVLFTDNFCLIFMSFFILKLKNIVNMRNRHYLKPPYNYLNYVKYGVK